MLKDYSFSKLKCDFKSDRRESGLAYVAILILVAIMSTLGLSFLHMAVTGTRITMNRGKYIQADYLAETAVNHAMWRLLNEPGFPKKEDVYYMHSLAGDRYGYKVIRPTATTFAGIATIGAVGDNSVLHRNVPYIIPEKVMTLYGNTSPTSHPYRRLVGASLDPENPTFDIGSSVAYWVELEGHPFADEFVVGLLDEDNDIELGVWDGQSWGNTLQFIDSSKREHKCFDIAYATHNGHAFAFGADDHQRGAVLYTVWDGSNWTAPAQAFDTGSEEEIRYIDAEGSPTSGEILIAVLYRNKKISLHRWTPDTGFDDPPFPFIFEAEAAKDKGMVVNITYEQKSGEAVIVWAQNRSAACKFVTWDGSDLSEAQELPPFTDDGRTIRMAADTTSNTILLMAIDKAMDVHAAVWNGFEWTDSHRFEDNAEQDAGPAGVSYINCDVAWEESGSEALAAWGKRNEDTIRYIRWVKGTPLSSAVLNGPDFQGRIKAVRMCPVPGSDRIVMACNNQHKYLRYTLWDGDRFRGNPAVLLTDSQPLDKKLSYDIAFRTYLAGPSAAAAP